MSRAYRGLIGVCWGLGLLSMVAGVVFKLAPTLAERTSLSARGGLIMAGVLFLCALATGEMARPGSPGS